MKVAAISSKAKKSVQTTKAPEASTCGVESPGKSEREKCRKCWRDSRWPNRALAAQKTALRTQKLRAAKAKIVTKEASL